MIKSDGGQRMSDPREVFGDWASQELWKRDTEIARLQTENQRLNAELKSATMMMQHFYERAEGFAKQIREQDALITELADALQRRGRFANSCFDDSDLLKQARKATKDE